jgi:hypothetical protein
VGGLVAECAARRVEVVEVVAAGLLGVAVAGTGAADVTVVPGRGSAPGDGELHAATAAPNAKAIVAVMR